MCMRDLLHLCSLGLLMCQVHLHAVVQDRLHTERSVPLQHRFDVVLILARHKLTVERAFHHHFKQARTKSFPCKFHQLKKEAHIHCLLVILRNECQFPAIGGKIITFVTERNASGKGSQNIVSVLDICGACF